MLHVLDNVYNWFVDFFAGHSHCTNFKGEQSDFQQITASIIQGSGLGPARYVVNAADLIPKYNSNALIKYADDTYLVVPAGSISTRQDELHNIEQWSLANNLKLNRTKSLEIIFVNNRRKHSTQLPAELTDIKRVDSINILGVTVTNTLTVNEHVDRVLSNCAQSVFALRTLRAHGLNRECLHNVFNAVILAKLTYAVSAWICFTYAAERERIEAFIRRCKRSELCSAKTKTFAEICEVYDSKLFSNIIIIHVIYSTNYFRQSPQLQKTTTSDHANIIDCFQNVLHVSLMLILFTEIFTVTFINDCAVTIYNFIVEVAVCQPLIL